MGDDSARREAGFVVTDRIDLTVSGSAGVVTAVTSHLAFLQGETLAESVGFAKLTEGFAGEAGDGDEVVVRVSRR